MKKFTLLCILTIFSCVCCNNAWSQDYFSGNTYYDVKGRAYYYTNEGKAYYYPESVPQENIVGNAQLNNSELDKNFFILSKRQLKQKENNQVSPRIFCENVVTESGELDNNAAQQKTEQLEKSE